MRTLRFPFAFLFAFAATALLTAGCAEDVGDIDRTNPNRIAKAELEGEWFFQQTVVGVNANAVSTYVGDEGPTEQIEWEIQEDYLVAYRTYESIIGADALAVPGGGPPDHGDPVIAFPIQSHFDIQRAYNSSTGEQSNVIVENASDRNWYERDYIRVDWTTNEITTTVDYLLEDVVSISDIALAPQDQGPDQTWFVERNEQGEVVYIDILTTYVIETDWIECALEYGIPLWGGDCGPETVQIRTSIVKITEDSTYLPREYDDYQMNDFGFFQTHRVVYDQRFGATDSSRVHLINRYNIWERSVDDAGNVIPYAERQPRPIAYYLSPNFPEELKETMFDIGHDYDNALRRIVAAHRGYTITANIAEVEEIPFSEIPRMFYLCDNPGGTDGPFAVSNEGYTNGVCQRPGETKNLGDIRYSYMAWINHPQLSSPLGVGPSTVNYQTGEVISARAYIFGQGVDTYMQRAIDIAKIINGEIEFEDYAYGRTIQDYFENLRRENSGDLFFGKVEELQQRAAHIHRAVQEHLAQPRVQAVLRTDPNEFRLRSEAQRSPLEQLRGTQLERMAIFPEVQERMSLGELDGTQRLDDEWVDALSIASIGDPVQMLDDFENRIDRFMNHGPDHDCVLTLDAFDPSLLGVARDLAREREALLAQGMSEEEVDVTQWNNLRNQLLRFVMAHEVGHNFGLFHNFEGSFDALNYSRGYWELREETFDRCDENRITFNNDGFFSGNIAPFACDGNETAAEYRQRSADLLQHLYEENISRYQTSTIMEYSPRYYNVAPGLGYYDYAALAYGYGELVEIFNEAPYMLRVETRYDANDDLSGTTLTRSDHRITTFDDVDEYIIHRRNETRGDDPAYTREERDLGHEHSYEYYHYSTLPTMFNGDIDWMYDRRLVPEPEVGSGVVVPYRFCGDFYRNTRTECNWFDQGADFSEIFNDIKDGWEFEYYLRFFRRDRPGFGLWMYPVLTSMYNYTMAPMTRLYQHWLIRAAGRGVAWYTADFAGDDASSAAFAAIDFLGNVVTTPTIGTYYFDEDDGMFMNISDDLDYRAPFYFEVEENIAENDYMNITADVGRYGFEQYVRNEDEELGFWGFVKPEIYSWFWAKWVAMMALVLPSVEVIGTDTSSDSTAFSIPIYLIFPEEMTSFFGALPREDFTVIGNCVTMNGDGKADRILQRNLATGAPAECDDADSLVLNPYTDVYGNSDFNIRLLSILYAAAYFQSNYDMSWFDTSNIYILGRGYTPTPAEGFVFETFEDDDGLVYAASRPEEMDADVDENIFVGVQLVRRANALKARRDAEEELNGRTSDYFSYSFDLDSLIEDMRLLNQANSIFEGWNVFLPSTL